MTTKELKKLKEIKEEKYLKLYRKINTLEFAFIIDGKIGDYQFKKLTDCYKLLFNDFYEATTKEDVVNAENKIENILNFLKR